MRAYKDGYSDTTLLDILKGCRKYNVTTLLIESNFGDGIVAELFKKHIAQTKQPLNVEETRANVRKEDRIIDTLEPVLNQHRLVVDKSVIEWDYASNPDTAPEKRTPEYMLFYQMSRMCREKGAVRHDDRIDALAQGVQYFIDALSISAQQEIITRRQMTGKTSLHIGKTTLTALQITWFLTWIWTKDDSQEAKPKTVLRPGFSASPPLYRGKGGPSVPGTLRSPFLLRPPQ